MSQKLYLPGTQEEVYENNAVKISDLKSLPTEDRRWASWCHIWVYPSPSYLHPFSAPSNASSLSTPPASASSFKMTPGFNFMYLVFALTWISGALLQDRQKKTASGNSVSTGVLGHPFSTTNLGVFEEICQNALWGCEITWKLKTSTEILISDCIPRAIKANLSKWREEGGTEWGCGGERTSFERVC